MKNTGKSTSGSSVKSGLSKQEKFKAGQDQLQGSPKGAQARKPHNDSKC